MVGSPKVSNSETGLEKPWGSTEAFQGFHKDVKTIHFNNILTIMPITDIFLY